VKILVSPNCSENMFREQGLADMHFMNNLAEINAVDISDLYQDSETETSKLGDICKNSSLALSMCDTCT
jgi:hypothetical protein